MIVRSLDASRRSALPRLTVDASRRRQTLHRFKKPRVLFFLTTYRQAVESTRKGNTAAAGVPINYPPTPSGPFLPVSKSLPARSTRRGTVLPRLTVDASSSRKHLRLYIIFFS